MKTLNNFWETCDPKFAHLTPNFGFTNTLGAKYLEQMDWNAETVLDFGCGAGWLGEWLFQNAKIKKYIAVDIAKRQLDAAKSQLRQYADKCQFVLLPQTSLPKADVVVAIAVLYHLPDEKSYHNTLQLLRSTDADRMLLQWRTNRKDRLLFTNGGVSISGLKRACFTTTESILEHLPDYTATLIFGPATNPDHPKDDPNHDSCYGIFEKTKPESQIQI